MAKTASKSSTDMSHVIHVVDGRKGGVGKSMFASALADKFLKEGRDGEVFLIDGDATNPDVGRRYTQTNTKVAYADLRKPDEWLTALAFVEESKREQVVVSLPATAAIGERAATLQAAAAEMGFSIFTYFVIGKAPDCIDLLAESFRSGTISVSDKFAVVINEREGKADTFKRWDASPIKKEILADPRHTIITMPELFYSAVDVLETAANFAPTSIIQSGQMMVVTRMELTGWLNKITSQVDAMTEKRIPENVG
jgi:MinD-like ATPase involved in chromosome partitioning or flagellar assembly